MYTCNLDIHVIGVADKKDVFRLEVTVDDALRVQVLHGLQELLHEQLGVGLRIILLLYDALKELPAPHELHHNVHLPLCV
jgi:hypothetical protein